ncbi:MAG: NADP-dependent oxidoreductase [Actinobacteria bacterium]|nr:NADP-dependent oxidoreductase [Actinomycetota bacterium]
MAELMRAVVAQQTGDADVLAVDEVDKPTPGPGEVLIRNHAAGINPVDWKTRRGGGVAGQVGEPPWILGWDVAGVVEAVGPDVAQFATGDAVFGMVRFPELGRAYAEHVAAPAEHLASKPASISAVEAAALPLVALTAWQALFDHAGLQPGATVLIHAAAGGVGHVAVQLAKWKDARVIGTSSRHADFLRSLGVDEVIDYTSTDFAEAVDDVDVVIDPIGGDTLVRSLDVLVPEGVLVRLSSLSDEERQLADERGVRATGMLVEPDGEQLARIAALVDEGVLEPRVQATYRLDEAPDAHRVSEDGHVCGKLVLHVPGPRR